MWLEGFCSRDTPTTTRCALSWERKNDSVFTTTSIPNRAGTCMGQVGPRSYEVNVGKSVYRRNRRQLVRSKEPPDPDPPKMAPSTSEPGQAEPARQSPRSPMPQHQPAPQSFRRSQRIRRLPARLRAVPAIVTAHTFCASQDTRVSRGGAS